MEAMVGIWQGREDSRCLGMLWGLLLFFKLSPWEPKQSSRWGKNDLRHFFFFFLTKRILLMQLQAECLLHHG